jgi:hypothetical protein
MNPTSFKNQFSLEYLARTPDSSSSAASDADVLPAGFDAVMQSYSGRILQIMQSAPDAKITLLALAQESGTRLEALLPVLQYMVRKGTVERVVADPSGNDTYRAVAVAA